jgi:hypothetical protein
MGVDSWLNAARPGRLGMQALRRSMDHEAMGAIQGY